MDARVFERFISCHTAMRASFAWEAKRSMNIACARSLLTEALQRIEDAVGRL